MGLAAGGVCVQRAITRICGARVMPLKRAPSGFFDEIEGSTERAFQIAFASENAGACDCLGAWRFLVYQRDYA